MKKTRATSYISDKIRVAIIELNAPLTVGDEIRISGGSTDYQQTVKSMKIEHEAVQRAKSGQIIGLKKTKRAREGNMDYKLDRPVRCILSMIEAQASRDQFRSHTLLLQYWFYRHRLL